MLLMVTGVLALVGIGLILDFFLWTTQGHRAAGTIARFEKDMPVFEFDTEGGERQVVRASGIMHIGYRLGSPQDGDVFNIIYRETPDGLLVRVHGYQNLVVGVLLFLPFMAALAISAGNFWATSQVSFIAVLAGLLIGCWALMKFIRVNY